MSSSDAPSGSSAIRLGCYIGLLSGVALLGYGLKLLFGESDTQIPFRVALCLAGIIQLVVCGGSLQQRRTAWAFALSLNGTMAVIFLFGATRIRDAFEIHALISLIPALAFALVTTLLAMGAERFERSAAP